MLDKIFAAPAYAQSAGSAPGFDFMSFVPLILIFMAFYFFLMRPQQKKAQEQREMLLALKEGDQVVTAGGIIGTVSKVVSDHELLVDIGSGGSVRVVRHTIVECLDSKDLKNQVTRKKESNIKSISEAKSKPTNARKPRNRSTTTKKTKDT